MLLDIAARFGPRGETILFQDGPFAEALRARGLACRIEPLSARVAGQTKQAGWLEGLQAVPGVARHAARLARILAAFDVVYTNTPKALLLGTLAAQRARRPLVHHLHDILDASHFSGLNRKLLVTAANRSAAVIANSEATARAFIDAGGRETLVTVIPNGFDLARFESPPSPQRIAPLRDELELGDAFAIGVFGRLAPWKGQAGVLEAVAALPETRAVLVGSALFTAEDRAYEATLRERAGAPDLRGRVQFAGFRDDVVDLMHALDAVVHSSTSPEPFGRVIVEAMLCGKPVVAARAGGALEIVEDGLTGLLSTPGDPADLATQLTWIQHHPTESAAMALRAQQTARQRYDLETILKLIEATLTRVSQRT